MSTREFAHRQTNRLLTDLTAQIARTIKTPDAEAVHDLRVAMRKFKSVLRALEPCFRGKAVKTTGRRLKQIMALAGSVRDRDIAMSLLKSGPLMEEARKAREEAAQAIVASLKSWVAQKSASKWRRELRAGGADGKLCDTPIAETVDSMLPRMMKDYLQQGEEAARANSSARELHKFRIATKKLRYTVDLFAPVYKEPVAELVEELKDMQTVLGDSNDIAVVRRMVPRSYHEVREALKQKQRKKADKFRKMWPDKHHHWTNNPVS